ncbi:TPA: hypothetical protein PCI30_000826 [Klebsiella pneumoniae]|nr:hypothetical protein [Klebsiella pneumoniae]
MAKTIQLSYAALVFTDARTGQGYLRKLDEFEANLLASQLTALDGGLLKARPVHPVEIRLVTVEEMRLANAIQVQDAPPEYCAAAKDGECCHPRCPQIHDGEPAFSGRHCPLDKGDEND